MKTNFEKSTLAYVWKAIDEEKQTLRSVSLQLECGVDVVNQMYIAAKKLFYKKYPPKATTKDFTKKTIIRPPAHYSNRSPYGIAQPGINFLNIK